MRASREIFLQEFKKGVSHPGRARLFVSIKFPQEGSLPNDISCSIPGRSATRADVPLLHHANLAVAHHMGDDDFLLGLATTELEEWWLPDGEGFNGRHEGPGGVRAWYTWALSKEDEGLSAAFWTAAATVTRERHRADLKGGIESLPPPLTVHSYNKGLAKLGLPYLAYPVAGGGEGPAQPIPGDWTFNPKSGILSPSPVSSGGLKLPGWLSAAFGPVLPANFRKNAESFASTGLNDLAVGLGAFGYAGVIAPVEFLTQGGKVQPFNIRAARSGGRLGVMVGAGVVLPEALPEILPVSAGTVLAGGAVNAGLGAALDELTNQHVATSSLITSFMEGELFVGAFGGVGRAGAALGGKAGSIASLLGFGALVGGGSSAVQGGSPAQILESAGTSAALVGLFEAAPTLGRASGRFVDALLFPTAEGGAYESPAANAFASLTRAVSGLKTAIKLHLWGPSFARGPAPELGAEYGTGLPKDLTQAPAFQGSTAASLRMGPEAPLSPNRLLTVEETLAPEASLEPVKLLKSDFEALQEFQDYGQTAAQRNALNEFYGAQGKVFEPGTYAPPKVPVRLAYESPVASFFKLSDFMSTEGPTPDVVAEWAPGQHGPLSYSRPSQFSPGLFDYFAQGEGVPAEEDLLPEGRGVSEKGVPPPLKAPAEPPSPLPRKDYTDLLSKERGYQGSVYDFFNPEESVPGTVEPRAAQDYIARLREEYAQSKLKDFSVPYAPAAETGYIAPTGSRSGLVNGLYGTQIGAYLGAAIANSLAKKRKAQQGASVVVEENPTFAVYPPGVQAPIMNSGSARDPYIAELVGNINEPINVPSGRVASFPTSVLIEGLSEKSASVSAAAIRSALGTSMKVGSPQVASPSIKTALGTSSMTSSKSLVGTLPLYSLTPGQLDPSLLAPTSEQVEEVQIGLGISIPEVVVPQPTPTRKVGGVPTLPGFGGAWLSSRKKKKDLFGYNFTVHPVSKTLIGDLYKTPKKPASKKAPHKAAPPRRRSRGKRRARAPWDW